MTRRAGKEIALFRGRLNRRRTATGFASRSTKTERKRTVAQPWKGIFRRETRRFRRSKTNCANENVAKIASNDEKNVYPRSFFDGLGLLKSSVVSPRTSKRSRRETAENSPFDGKPPNFKRSTVKSPVRTINSRACGRVLRRNGRALKDAAGALRSAKKMGPFAASKREKRTERTDVWSRRRSRFDGRLDNLDAALNASRVSS